MDAAQLAKLSLGLSKALYPPILLTETGSTAYGTNVGTGDLDVLGVFVEPLDHIFSLRKPAGSWCWTSGDLKERGTPTDVDITLHSLRKFMKLASAGNPAILHMLFSKRIYLAGTGASSILSSPPTDAGSQLQAHKKFFISKQAGPRYAAYMTSQMRRLKGEIGQKNVNRTDLESEFGYDTKYAMHVARLGLEGTELMDTGQISVPMREEDRELCLTIRRGEVPYETLIPMLEGIRDRLELAIEKSKLPEYPKFQVLTDLSIKLHCGS